MRNGTSRPLPERLPGGRVASVGASGGAQLPLWAQLALVGRVDDARDDLAVGARGQPQGAAGSGRPAPLP